MRAALHVRCLFLWLFAWALSGCATQPSRVAADKLTLATAEEGLLVVSYARSSPDDRFSTERVYLREIVRRKKYEIGVNTLVFVPLKFDFETDGSHGSLAVLKLPAGDYEIYDFSVTQDTIGGVIMHSPTNRFSIPFSVRAGRVSYLGELKIERIRSARILGIPGADKVRFELSDQAARDLPLFVRLYPAITWPVDHVKPGSEHTTPFIRIE